MSAREITPKTYPVTLTGDYRDVDLVAGWSPEVPYVKSWIAVEAAYGNGFLDRLEHRQQYKVNGFRVFNLGQHQITLFGIGYYGFSYIPGLVPLNVSGLQDTIDPRQRDQTHTGELAGNDIWKLSSGQQLQLSGHILGEWTTGIAVKRSPANRSDDTLAQKRTLESHKRTHRGERRMAKCRYKYPI